MPLNLIWEKFWKLTVLSKWKPFIRNNWKTLTQWECLCECGNKKNITWTNLSRWLTKSCWCIVKENISISNKKHWMSNTDIYNVYKSMKQRCSDINCKSFINYGWKWVKCLWLSFEEFYDDMNKTYKKWLTIDRIDVYWNYCKENCRRATYSEQQNNKRNTRYVTYNWNTLTLAQRWERVWKKYTQMASYYYSWKELDKFLF